MQDKQVLKKNETPEMIDEIKFNLAQLHHDLAIYPRISSSVFESDDPNAASILFNGAEKRRTKQ